MNELTTHGSVQEIHHRSHGWEIVIGTNDFGHITLEGEGMPPLGFGAGVTVVIREDMIQ